MGFMTKTIIKTSNAPASYGPYSQGVKAGGFIFCAGQGGFDPAAGKNVEGGIRAQTAQALRNIEAILVAGGSSLEQVVKATIFLHDWNDFIAMNETFATFFPNDPPARSTIRGERYPPGALVAIEAIALA